MHFERGAFFVVHFLLYFEGTDLVRMLTSPPRRQDGLARQKSHAIKTRSPPSSSHKFANLRDPFIFFAKCWDSCTFEHLPACGIPS